MTVFRTTALVVAWPILALICLLVLQQHTVTGRAILGVDLGSLYMKVALVQSGSPLEIVTNMHSKRKTEQMILFDNGHQRFYGADAAALLARKSHTTPAAMTLMLGRDNEHPVVKV
jgi:hypoxia up-regulated 1